MLLFFAPFAAAYVLYELADRGLWKDLRVWASLGVAAILVVAASVPLLLPIAQAGVDLAQAQLQAARAGQELSELQRQRAFNAAHLADRPARETAWRQDLPGEFERQRAVAGNQAERIQGGVHGPCLVSLHSVND